MFNESDIERIIGSTVKDREGDKIGSVDQLFMDDATGQPSWVTVNTGLFGTSTNFVPLDGASLEGDGDLVVPHSKDTVKDAPRMDAEQHLSPAEEDELYRYYGLTSGTTGQTTGTQTTGQTTDTTTTAGTAAAGTAGVAGAGYATGDRTDADRTDYDRTGTAHADAGLADDGSITRNEEQLKVGTETVESGRARLRKYVTTEEQSVTVPVQKEKLVVEREPLDGTQRAAGGITDDGDSVEEITLREERVVADKETVSVENVRVGTETVTEEQTVSDEVRKEHIEVDGEDIDGGTTRA